MKQNKISSNFEQNYTEAEKAQARQNIGLAEVAHSGDFNDLIKKPAQITGQVQSNWLQTNETAVDFIRNKPTIHTYTAGSNVKISDQDVVSSLHGLKSYSRTQPTGGYGDMVEDDTILGIYHISPPTIVNNDKKNNIVYEYKVTDITNVSYFDIGYAMTPDADGFVPNVHFIIDLTGEITDDSTPGMIISPHDWLTLNVGYGNVKAQLANYSARWIPILIGHKYLVDFYGNVAHVSILGENRVQDIAPNFGDVHESLSTDPNTTHYDITYKLERYTVYHMDILTNALQAENTDKYTYRIGLGIYGTQNIRYLTGWNRVDSGDSIHQHLDFTSDIYRSMFIEFDQAQYPMATQTVNLMIVGTKERF